MDLVSDLFTIPASHVVHHFSGVRAEGAWI